VRHDHSDFSTSLVTANEGIESSRFPPFCICGNGCPETKGRIATTIRPFTAGQFCFLVSLSRLYC